MMFHTRLIHILVTFLFSISCTQLFELFPQYPTLRPRLLSGTLLSRQRLKSGKWISWCFFFIYCECCFVLGPSITEIYFFVLYSTTLVHCWLEFMKAVMSLRRVNSNCVTRSYFFFPSAIYFIFPWYIKKKVCQRCKSRFVCRLTRWLCETLLPCLRVREGPLTRLIKTTCERWSFVCHRAAPPLHHKDHTSFKDVHVYTSSPVVQIPCAVPFRDCNSNHLSSPPFYFYMLTR